MVKQLINKIAYSNKDVMLTSSEGTTLFIRRSDDRKDKKVYLKEFFNERDALGMLGVTIRVFENPNERICTLFIDRHNEVSFAKKETTADVLKKEMENKITNIPEVVDEFTNMFGIISEEGFEATEIETIREIAKKVSKHKGTIMIITKSVKEDSDRIAIFGKDDAETVKEAIIYDLFEEYTKDELEEGIYTQFEIYCEESNKECHIIVCDEEIVLVDKERVKDIHIEDFKENNPDEKPEESEELTNYINNCVDEFENVFGKFRNQSLVEKDIYMKKNNKEVHI